MQLNRSRTFWVSALALSLAGCGGEVDYDRADAQALPTPPQVVDGPPMIGDSYTIAGKHYEPRDDTAFDQVGYARVFGEERRGTGSPNGEIVNPDLIEAAHQTLPMASYVEVTHLDTGKTILVRINDRGPMTNSAIISLSPAAARELGLTSASGTAVRVRRVNPSTAEKAALRSGRPASARLDTPPSLLTALRRQLKDQGTAADPGPVEAASPRIAEKPVSKPAPRTVPRSPSRAGAEFDGPVLTGKTAETDSDTTETATKVVGKPAIVTKSIQNADGGMSGTWYVQLGAFANANSARSLAKRAGASAVQVDRIWRVRAGPYDSEDSARAAAANFAQKGYRGASAVR